VHCAATDRYLLLARPQQQSLLLWSCWDKTDTWTDKQTDRGEPVPEGKTNLDLNDARDSECQWHQLGHMQVCTSLWTENHASTLSLSFLQARCPSCCPTNKGTSSSSSLIKK